MSSSDAGGSHVEEDPTFDGIVQNVVGQDFPSLYEVVHMMDCSISCSRLALAPSYRSTSNLQASNPLPRSISRLSLQQHLQCVEHLPRILNSHVSEGAQTDHSFRVRLHRIQMICHAQVDSVKVRSFMERPIRPVRSRLPSRSHSLSATCHAHLGRKSSSTSPSVVRKRTRITLQKKRNH